MDSTAVDTAEAPVSFPMFAAVAAGMTGKSVYEVLELVGGLFEAAGAVFEGSPDAPGTLIALLPPSDRAATNAAQLGLSAQAIAPALRLGIDATEVHSKQEQDARWQQVIDSAVRLQKAARTGEAIAGDTMEQLTDGGAATEALLVGDEIYLLLTGMRELSAVPDPVPDVEAPVAVEEEPVPFVEAPVTVVEAPVAVAAPMMHPTARWDGPLVGRDAQVEDLRARFGRAVAERRAACVLVLGEPGVGRTRLVATLGREIGDARYLSIACAPADIGGARWPLAALVEALAGIDAHARVDDAHARLAELFAGQADANLVLPHLHAILALDGVTEADRLPWALRRLFEVTVRSPTLVQIDDTERAGAGFARLLADVTTSARETPLLIALTSTHETDMLPAIRLTPLRSEDAASLVTHLLGFAEPGVAATIAERVGGNPFVLEQALAMLTETGTLAAGQGRWMPLADLTLVPIPDTSMGLIRQRLQTLPPHELAVIGLAAIAGERVAAEPLLEVVPADARPGVPGHLADLVARGYLVMETPNTFRFRHPLLAQATTEGVPDWAQAATHERFGRHLERIAGDRLWRHADEIGDHLEASYRLHPGGPSGERTDALEMLTWSAAAAVDQGNLDGAARLERRAASLLDDDPARRAEFLYAAAEHRALAAPDRPADREIAEAALAASVAGDDVDWRVRLLRARLRTTAGHEDALEGARATADEAIAAFADDGLTWALSGAWALRGLVHATRAQNGMVADDLLKAADNAAAAHRWHEETAALRGAAAALLDGPVRVEEAEARCASFLPRVRGPLAEHDLRGALALLRARRSAFEDARSEIAGSIAELEELGANADLAVALHRAAQIEILVGQPASAEPQMQRALAAAALVHDDGLRAALAAAFAHILIADDERLDEAMALADVAEAHARDMAAQVGWRMARARVMARRGRGALAERLAREGLGLAEQTDSTDLRANALLDAADVRRQAGRPAEAEPFERRALRLFERRGATAQAAAITGVRPHEAQPQPKPAPAPALATTATANPPPAAADSGAAHLAEEFPNLSANGGEPARAMDPLRDDNAVTPPPAQTPVTYALDDLSAEDESKRRWFNR
ncbi:MAG: AAA family ATPase [Actinomycetota bacterium]